MELRAMSRCLPRCPHVLGVTILLMSLAALAQATPSRDLDELRERWSAAYEAGDAAAMADLYVEDAVRMPYDAPAVEGRGAIVDAYRAQFTGRRLTPHIELAVENVEIFDATAIERGRYDETLRSRDGAVQYREVGKYVSVVRLGVDGRWRFAISIFNRDAPRPAGRQ